jgi:hypothetical protein
MNSVAAGWPPSFWSFSSDGVRRRCPARPNGRLVAARTDRAPVSVGTNTRLQWTFRPAGELYVIYNHNLTDITDRWRLDSNQLLVKVQYSFRY